MWQHYGFRFLGLVLVLATEVEGFIGPLEVVLGFLPFGAVPFDKFLLRALNDSLEVPRLVLSKGQLAALVNLFVLL